MKKILCLVSFGVALVACTDEYVGETYKESEKTVFEPVSDYNETFGRSVVLGQKLNNPYTLKNMQLAYDSLCDAGLLTRTTELLEPTHLYVRFLPKDSSDFNLLEKDSLDLFCYPLDYDVEEWGDYYHDPTIPEDQPTWQYTKVPVGYQFPKIQYEVLDTCFIPDEDEDETRSGVNTISLDGLEDAAYEISGNGDMLEKSSLRAKHSPSGRMTVYNSAKGTYEGVAGIAVRMGKFVKWFHVYTDKDGYYSTKSTFRTDPHYWVFFENKKGFKIGFWSVFANARLHALGTHSNKGYNHAFERSSIVWEDCVVNNAAYYMYENFGSYIPSNMRLWTCGLTNESNAAMLNHHTAPKEKIGALLGTAMTPAMTAVILMAPDIIIGTKNYDYYEMFTTTAHELAHSMHFKKVGSTYWNKYIDGIIACKATTGHPYGKKATDTDYSGYIGVGETWGNGMEYYVGQTVFGYTVFTLETYWFNPEATYDLLYNNIIITPVKFLSCMNSNCVNLNRLNFYLRQLDASISASLYE